MVRQAIIKKYKSQIAELRSLMSKVDKANAEPKDMATLGNFLREHPGLWAYGGNLAEWAIMELIDGVSESSFLRQTLRVGHEQLSQDLGEGRGNLLEQLLIQQVVLAWLRLAIVEYAYSAATNEETSFVKWDYLEKRLNASQRRFLRACESLARIRRLNVPVVQLNVAQQQINQVHTSG